MPQDLTWDTAEEIAILLSQKYPELSPLAVPLTDLRRHVTALPGFKDDPSILTEAKLEAIQSAWQEEYQDRTRD
jgi:FeS assembly protein IscX